MAPPTPRSRSSPPCVLRFANQRSAPVRVVWCDYEGKEVPYGIVQPHCSFNQATFSGHPWRIKDEATGTVVAEYVGPTATIILQPDGSQAVLPGLQRVQQAPVHHPAFGTYRQRGEALGIPIVAFDCVQPEAVAVAVETLCYMLADVDEGLVRRLAELGAELAIIGTKQNTTDIPPHSHLRGLQSGNGCGTYDEACRGLGGQITCPTTSVGEENLLMTEADRYKCESILVHEFAHMVMDVGLHEHPLRDAILQAYRQAHDSGAYDLSAYIMLNESEYWAEATQIWFNATVRTDVTSGMTTREAIKARDPRLAGVLAAVWGDGLWRYPYTAPHTFASFLGSPGTASAAAASAKVSEGAATQQQQRQQQEEQRLWWHRQEQLLQPHGYPAVVNGGKTQIVSRMGGHGMLGVPWHAPGLVQVQHNPQAAAAESSSFWSDVLAFICCAPRRRPRRKKQRAPGDRLPILVQAPGVAPTPKR